MIHQLTTEIFTQRAKAVHGDKYDYSKVEYKNSQTKVCIICPEHGEFWMKPNNHMNGQNCPICKGKFKRTTEWFINEARKIHGDKYDYSKAEYIKSDVETTIICKRCGTEFLQTPNKHLQGHGCSYCNYGRFTTEEFVQRSKAAHGDKYDYSKSKYINNNTKVEIICPRHGSFWQIPRNHFVGIGCPKCGQGTMTREEFFAKAAELYGDRFDYSKTEFNGISKDIKIVCKRCGKELTVNARAHLESGYCYLCGEHHTLSQEEFLERAKAIHGEKYDYSLAEYAGIDGKVHLVCKKCGKDFWQTAYNHLNGCGCPRCKSSVGEKKVAEYLTEHSISFETQKRFDTCKNKRSLPFDFYLPDHNLCIEYQGVQHFRPVKDFGGEESYRMTKKNDEIKSEWCSRPENPNLLTISYIEDVNEVLNKAL